MIQAEMALANQTEAEELLQRVSAVLYGNYTLASGEVSDYYFDSKELTLDPEGAEFVADQFLKQIEDEGIDVVGGPAYGAIPIVSHICLYSRVRGGKAVPAFYVRRESKGHGTNKLAEGKIPAERAKVAIVDDVVTTGKSLLDAIERAEEQGCRVRSALVLVDRNEGAKEEVEGRGYNFWALFTVCRTEEGNVRLRFNGT